MLEVSLAISPILALLICLLALKLSAVKSAIVSAGLTVILFVAYYRADAFAVGIASLKGLSLALFVVLIIWSAMFLYNLVKETGAMDVISGSIRNAIQDEFIQFVLLSWVFSAFLQGIAGFGVPVIIVSPILISLGFDPVKSAAAVLVGHSWAISFGSMGSSIYAIGLVTETSQSLIVFSMALFGIAGLLCTGLAVCFIYGGFRALLRGLPYVLLLVTVMGAMLLLLAKLEMISVIGVLTGLVGLIAFYGIYRLRFRKIESKAKAADIRSEDRQLANAPDTGSASTQTADVLIAKGQSANAPDIRPASTQAADVLIAKGQSANAPDIGSASTQTADTRSASVQSADAKDAEKPGLRLGEAVLPYLLIVVFSLAMYFINPKPAINIDFPEYETLLHRVVAAATGYVKFNILKYPFTIIMVSSFICLALYCRRGVFGQSHASRIIRATVKKCVPTTITIAFLLIMAVVMMDSGMTDAIAGFLVAATGGFYPVVAPFIGLLGAFVTGSNTNSNIIFGALQENAARSIGLPPAAICGAQSIGASVGGGIGPTTVALGATAAHIQKQESKIYRKTLLPILLTTAILGLINFLIAAFAEMR
jgi:lactate permease